MKMISEPKQKAKHSHLLVLMTNSVSRKELGAVSDILLFLLRYPFLLNNTSNTQNSCVQETPQLNAPQGNIYMGARYLDPKYSRWISVDPALGEYIPAAGKGNSENAGNLPGMGGIYNHINGRLYHYAGNNPVRYIDPDGRKINLSNTRKENYNAILDMINKMSILQYKIKDGKLRIDFEKENQNGSKTFTKDMFYAFCSNYDISICFGDKVPPSIDAETPDVIGGTCYFYKESKKVVIFLAITNYPFIKTKDGQTYMTNRYEVFGHELAGHIVPEIKNINGNAVSIENRIRREMKWVEREEEPEHASF